MCRLRATKRTPSIVSATTRRPDGARVTTCSALTGSEQTAAATRMAAAKTNATPGLATPMSTAATAGPASHEIPSKMLQTPLHATSCSGVRARSGKSAHSAGRNRTAQMLSSAASANTSATGAPAKNAIAVAPASTARAR